MKRVLVTGSGGLIGNEAVRFFAERDFEVTGIDNDMRRYFFGDEASTRQNINSIKETVSGYRHFWADIRDNKAVDKIFSKNSFDLLIHAAAQPSHDWAAREPQTDFSVNANGTLNLLEAFRKYMPEGIFVFLSTNKVYGDLPNRLPLKELKTRYELDPSHPFFKGIDETMSIDQSAHSLFGASKVAADILVQEYGRYFGLKTACFRGGCLTGARHCGAEMHGFLAYLGKCIATGKTYNIFGYEGKQVRDNIHAFDVVNAVYHFYLNPRCGSVYNLGGGRSSNISILEAIRKFEKLLNKKARIKYVSHSRKGDHKWYISDFSKFKRHYPDWTLSYTQDQIFEDICFNRRSSRRRKKS